MSEGVRTPRPPPCGPRPSAASLIRGQGGRRTSRRPILSQSASQIGPNCPEGHPRQPDRGSTAISPLAAGRSRPGRLLIVRQLRGSASHERVANLEHYLAFTCTCNYAINVPLCRERLGGETASDASTIGRRTCWSSCGAGVADGVSPRPCVSRHLTSRLRELDRRNDERSRSGVSRGPRLQDAVLRRGDSPLRRVETQEVPRGAARRGRPRGRMLRAAMSRSAVMACSFAAPPHPRSWPPFVAQRRIRDRQAAALDRPVEDRSRMSLCRQQPPSSGPDGSATLLAQPSSTESLLVTEVLHRSAAYVRVSGAGEHGGDPPLPGSLPPLETLSLRQEHVKSAREVSQRRVASIVRRERLAFRFCQLLPGPLRALRVSQTQSRRGDSNSRPLHYE